MVWYPYNVVVIAIDSFINTQDARIPDIIKIDVEGAELLVLQGGKEFFKNHKPIIFMEVHNILMMFYVHKFLLNHGLFCPDLGWKQFNPIEMFYNGTIGLNWFMIVMIWKLS